MAQDATTLEQVLTEGPASEEQDLVEPKDEQEKVDEQAKDEKDDDKGDGAERKETDSEFQSRVDSAVNKSTNSYRELREADTALIRSLRKENKALTVDDSGKKLDSAMETILDGDEENGFPLDKTEERRIAYDKIKAIYKEYKADKHEVNQAAEETRVLAGKLQPKMVKQFGLDDPNPNIRAVNQAKFIDDTVTAYKHTQDFLLVVGDFLPVGTDLRNDIESTVKGVAEFDDEKAKKLYIKDRLQGVKITPKKKPSVPSDNSGGSGLSAYERAVTELSK